MVTDNARQVIVRRLFEQGWNSGNPEPVSDIIETDYESNDGGFFRVGSDVPGGLERLTGADGDTVITIWTASGTAKNRTFIDSAGRERHYELADQGVSLTSVAEGKVTRHDMFWPGGLRDE